MEETRWTYVLVAIRAIGKCYVQTHDEAEAKDDQPNGKNNPMNTLSLSVHSFQRLLNTHLSKTDTKN